LQVVFVLSVVPAAWAAPIADFTISPPSPLPGETVTFTSTSQPDGDEINGWSWELGDGNAVPASPDATHAYPAGVYDVTLTVTDSSAESGSATKRIVVNTPPTPDFVVFPGQGILGQSLDFVSTSTDPDGQAVPGLGWNFNDGSPAAFGQHVQHAFDEAGTHMVTLNALDSLGGFNSTQKPVRVTSPTPLRTPTTPRETERRELRLLSPFPVVRLAGDLTDAGVRVRVLSVRAPRRALITVRCRGRTCPARRIRTRSRGRTLSFKRFRNRNLRTGSALAVLVSRADRIGKYTRFTIREGRSPKRTDRCLMPGASKGSRCPND
jgi:PKD repeat protein